MTSRDGANWSAVKVKLRDLGPAGLVALLRDLYRASPENRRFLHARLLGSEVEIDKYRRLIADAVYPDPLSTRAIRVGEAQRLVRHYRQATGDLGGTVDLLLTFVEAGTEQAADLGYGDDRYFMALERALDTAVEMADELPAGERAGIVRRVRRIADHAKDVGWGYGGYTDNVAAGFG